MIIVDRPLFFVQPLIVSLIIYSELFLYDTTHTRILLSPSLQKRPVSHGQSGQKVTLSIIGIVSKCSKFRTNIDTLSDSATPYSKCATPYTIGL